MESKLVSYNFRWYLPVFALTLAITVSAANAQKPYSVEEQVEAWRRRRLGLSDRGLNRP